MKSAAVVVALVALVVAVAAGFPSSAAAQELRASTGRQLLALEPSQVFLIACLTIGGFVLIVALLACIVVANRYGGVVEEETRQEKMAQQGNYSTAVVYTDTQATPAQPEVQQDYATQGFPGQAEQTSYPPQMTPQAGSGSGSGAGAGAIDDPVARLTSDAAAGVQ